MKAAKKKHSPKTKPRQHASSSSGRTLFVSSLTFLVIISFLLYSNTLGHGYVLDDYASITANTLVKQGVKAVPELFKTAYWYGLNGKNNSVYRPLSLIMFAAEWQWFPNNPFPSHLINVLLYMLTAALLFLFLQAIFQNKGLLVPLVITLLWIVHPVHTEVVANIKGRDEILAFLFSILCLFSSYRYALTKKKTFLVASVAAFALALFSKETALCVVVLAPATIWFFTKEKGKDFALPAFSLLIAAALYFAIRASVLDNQIPKDTLSINDNTLIGANSIERIATPFYIMGLYFKQMIFPVTLSDDYSFNQVPLVSFASPVALLSLVISMFLAGYAVTSFRTKSPVGYGIIIFFSSIALVSNMVILIGSTMADRFLYFPSLGFIIALVFALIWVFKIPVNERQTESSFSQSQKQSVLFAGVAIVALLFSVKTYSRNKDWKDNLALYSADILNAPNSSKLKFFYASTVLKYAKEGRPLPDNENKLLEKGLEQLRQGIAIDPGYYLLHLTLGDILKYQHKYSEAISAYQKAINLQPSNDMAYTNLGNTYYMMQKVDSALGMYLKAQDINAHNSNTLNGMGACYYSLASYELAVKYFSDAAKEDPSNADTYRNMGGALRGLQKYDEAITAYKSSIALNPDDADSYYYLGSVYNSKGEAASASECFRRAHQLQPGKY